MDPRKFAVFNVGMIIVFMEALMASDLGQTSTSTTSPTAEFKKVKLSANLTDIMDCEGTADCFRLFRIFKEVIRSMNDDRSVEYKFDMDNKATETYTKGGKYGKFLDDFKCLGKIIAAEKSRYPVFEENVMVKVSGMILSSNEKASDVHMGFFKDLLKLAADMVKPNKKRPNYEEAMGSIGKIEEAYAEFYAQVPKKVLDDAVEDQEERRMIRLV